MTVLNLKFVALAGCILTTSAGYAEMHTFTLQDGRALEAEVFDYNAASGKVTLKRPDGKRVPVKENLFIEADQQYIREWDSLKTFTSIRLLKINCDDKNVGEREEEQYENVVDTAGNVERTLMKVTTFEKIAFEFVFQNMNTAPLEGIRMNYIIYYEQSLETYEKPEEKQFSFAKEKILPALLGKKTTPIMTNSVEIHSDSINSISWTSGRSRVGGKGDVHGIRARIYMMTSSGKEVMREFSHPKALSLTKFPWKNQSAFNIR